ncbi:hypothetical protein LCGC14_2646070 [marine sediment metagenome]|uniref:Uncharacterized protein n=1 Tax=marine sediment metagenome TaxID=412755 RepID=A0A0F9AIG9_9ZZZZ
MDEVDKLMQELGYTEGEPTAIVDLEANIILHMVRGLSREAALQEMQLGTASQAQFLEMPVGQITDRSEDIEREY